MNTMVIVTVAAEVAFWTLLAFGLAARYLLKWPRTGKVLLLAIPVVEVGLLVAGVVDLARGADANQGHALAAIALGLTAAYGGRSLRWADAKFQHRFAGGAAPVKPPRGGAEHARRERAGWYRHLLAWVVGSGLMALAVAWIHDVDRTKVLLGTILGWAAILGIDFVISFSYTLWPRDSKQRTA